MEISSRREARAASGGQQTALLAGMIIAAILIGGAGVWLWQQPKVKAAFAARDDSQAELATQQSRIATLENQNRTLTDQGERLQGQVAQLTAERKALHDAVQVTTAPRDVASAYGRARLTRNNVWIQALMTDELAATYQFRPDMSNQTATRYSIIRESGAKEPWTYVVRVWESVPVRGEIGYTDAELEIIKVGDRYKIRSVKLTDHYAPEAK